MVAFESNCSGCHDDGYCMSNCPHKKVPHLYCDKCEDEVDDLYDVAGKQLCDICALSFLKIDISNLVGDIDEDMY